MSFHGVVCKLKRVSLVHDVNVGFRAVLCNMQRVMSGNVTRLMSAHELSWGVVRNGAELEGALLKC